MSLLEVSKISKSYGHKVLFENLSFAISAGQKVGLVARNGAGKTSLLDIVAGLDMPDSGECFLLPGIKVSYLRQEQQFQEGLSLLDTLLGSDSEIVRVVGKYERLYSEANLDPSPKTMKMLHEATLQMDAFQAWDLENRFKQIVSYLKIGDFATKVEQLSGGQLKRLALARVLFEEADLLLLDEPTNHLDLQMVEWLEGYLSRAKTTILLVTHDRYLLDAVCNVILEIDNGKLYGYNGNYTQYLFKKQERIENQDRIAEKARNLLRKEAEWMRRTPQARTTKSKARIDSFFQLQGQANVARESGTGKFVVEMAHLGKKILELENVLKTYDMKVVVNGFSYVFKRGERVGIIGPNGSGKTTLLNIISGCLKPDSGLVSKGETIKFGYYTQDGIMVDDSKKVIEVITDIAENLNMGKQGNYSAAQLLHYFGFPRHVQHDRVEKLSGGEKRRLYLVSVLVTNPNFLLLDEPTNDLDIDTLNLLEEFLEGFAGCMVIVSHDRYFVDSIVDHILVFDDNGNIKGFAGNYTQYRLEKSKRASLEEQKPKKEPGKQYQKPRKRSGLTYKEQREYQLLETEIEKLENEKRLLLEKMISGTLEGLELVRVSRRFELLEDEIESKTDRWLELSEK